MTDKPGKPSAAPATGAPGGPVAGQWLGLVVPKRHARRAVTRTLIKRQMRAAMAEGAAALPAGLWVLRLKSGFDLRTFPSAASDALRCSARAELRLLIDRAAAARPRS
jgi:ribonuclease P protein component